VGELLRERLQLVLAALPEIVDLELQVVARALAAIDHAVQDVLERLAHLALAPGEQLLLRGDGGGHIHAVAFSARSHRRLEAHPFDQLLRPALALGLELGRRQHRPRVVHRFRRPRIGGARRARLVRHGRCTRPRSGRHALLAAAVTTAAAAAPAATIAVLAALAVAALAALRALRRRRAGALPARRRSPPRPAVPPVAPPAPAAVAA